MKSNILYLLLVGTLFFLASCSPQVGLFYSINSEVELKEGVLSPELTAFALAVNGDVLLLAAGDLYFKEGSDDWTSVKAPQTMASSLALSTAYYTDAFYTCFTSVGGTETGLFSTADPTAEDFTWTEITAVPNASLVFAENGVLFVVAGTPNDYSLWSYDGSSFSEELSGLGSASNADIAWDGLKYWFIWGDSIYTGPLGGFLESDVSAFIMGPIDTFGGIHYDEASLTLYVSVKREDKGQVWVYKESGWELNTPDLEISHDFFSYTTDSDHIILLGSDDGYYEKSGDTFGPPDVSCSYNSYISLNLSNAVVHGFAMGFAMDDTTPPLYALTVNDGLWKNSGGTWSLE